MEVNVSVESPNEIKLDSPNQETKKDLAAIQDEFAKFLVITREKSSAAVDQGKSGFFAKLAEIKQKVRDQFDAVQTIKHLKPTEIEALKVFMEKVKQERHRPPAPPMKRPEGLELGLIGVALFSGNEIVSRAIRSVTKSSYSHVALLLHDVTKEPTDQEGWYVYSANGSASQIMADHTLPQVQLEKWTHTIDGYNGSIVKRLILFNDGVLPTTAVITELVDKYIGLPYERQVLVMIKAINRTNVEGANSADSAFCSEICYRFLVAAGVLENTEIAENVWPTDFSDESTRLKLAAAAWDLHVPVKGTPPPRPH